MHIQITRRIRSIEDKSLVHCHRGCEFEPRHSTMLFFLFIFLSIIYFKNIIHKYFQTIWVAKYCFT